jgi:DNA-binding PadR family transcriptional regulator
MECAEVPLPIRRTEILSPGAFVILTTLARVPLHGYGIMRDVAERSAGRFSLSASTVYPRLRVLERSGYVNRIVATDPSSSRTSVYRITAAGRNALSRETERLDVLRSLSSEHY